MSITVRQAKAVAEKKAYYKALYDGQSDDSFSDKAKEYYDKLNYYSSFDNLDVAKPQDNDSVQVGSVIRLKMPNNNIFSFEIVDTVIHGIDAVGSVISTKSSLGQVILGKEKGQKFTFLNGTQENKIKILEISGYEEPELGHQKVIEKV